MSTVPFSKSSAFEPGCWTLSRSAVASCRARSSLSIRRRRPSRCMPTREAFVPGTRWSRRVSRLWPSSGQVFSEESTTACSGACQGPSRCSAQTSGPPRSTRRGAGPSGPSSTPDSRWSPETCSGTCRRVPRSPFAHSCLTGSAVRSNGSLPRANSTSRSRSHVSREFRSRSRTTGLCAGRGRPGSVCGQTPHSSPDSGRSTSSSRSPEGGARRFPGGSVPARPSCSSRSPSGVMRM